ncbi:hypothetical protein T265_12036 [Opisthorchis viverrini]|uniref:Uncharacterized protein n=1 Tax=Opisthorchis viverrini TaxID=6198 RepID=A0A074Z0P9_OPIVI|nr:hypothetical protein T265_12036 [Opisthorchis viverrini]KER19047.1 hypothetical protein T265_12036 [Opisthorchis viverrini]
MFRYGILCNGNPLFESEETSQPTNKEQNILPKPKYADCDWSLRQTSWYAEEDPLSNCRVYGFRMEDLRRFLTTVYGFRMEDLRKFLTEIKPLEPNLASANSAPWANSGSDLSWRRAN